MARDIVKAIRNCRLPSIAAVDGICAGAGAILAMANDIGVLSSFAVENLFREIRALCNMKVPLRTKN